jgi:hypothetical protein
VMQSIKTILLFEAMYRYHVLGMPLDEIENQLQNYPTQDAEDLLKRVRQDISTDTLMRGGDEEESDISVVESEGQESGDKEEYRARFNAMLKQYGVTNIGELPPEKRKEFFSNIDKHWKAKNEGKVNEEFEWTDEIIADFIVEFAEFADMFDDIRREIQREFIAEGGTKKTSITRITRQTKIDRAAGNLATQYAKAKGDPLYKKMKKFKEKWLKFKKQIQSKYKTRVRTAARQGTGISNLIKKFEGGKEHGK